MKIIKKLQNKFGIHFLDSKVTEQTYFLHNEDDVFAKKIAKIIDDVILNRRSSKEKEWIYKIENLRNKLNQSRVEVQIMDYGARSSLSNLSANEMYHGTKIVKTVGEVSKNASKPYIWDLLLLKLIRRFRPMVCLELGTSVGISAAYQAAACKINKHGKVITIEGAENIASIALNNFEELKLDNIKVIIGRFQDVLKQTLIENEPIDYVFIDGHHDENATLDYFKQIMPYLSDHALLIFDDIRWSDGMERAWNQISKHKNIQLSINLTELGICVYTKLPKEQKKYFNISL